jgi:putative zinc finger/helix-turn-helix YgiT family protein
MADRKKIQPEIEPQICVHEDLQPKVIRDESDYGPENDRIHLVIDDVPVLVCPQCGEIFYGPEAEKAHNLAICKAYHLLPPDEVKAIREQLGKTQEEFAELTGIGVATLSRWEKGRLIQTRAHDNYLRILQSVPAAVRVLVRAKVDPAEVLERWERFRLHAKGTRPQTEAERQVGSMSPSPVEELSAR